MLPDIPEGAKLSRLLHASLQALNPKNREDLAMLDALILCVSDKEFDECSLKLLGLDAGGVRGMPDDGLNARELDCENLDEVLCIGPSPLLKVVWKPLSG